MKGVPKPFLLESHWWVEFYGTLKGTKRQHVNTIFEDKVKIGLSGSDGS